MLAPLVAHEATKVSRDVYIDAYVSQRWPNIPLSQLAKIEETVTANINMIKVNVIEEEDDEWMRDLIGFLVNGTFLGDEDMVKKVRLRAPRFEMRNGKLYKRYYSELVLQCVNRREAREIMIDIHERTCLAHQGMEV